EGEQHLDLVAPLPQFLAQRAGQLGVVVGAADVLAGRQVQGDDVLPGHAALLAVVLGEGQGVGDVLVDDGEDVFGAEGGGGCGGQGQQQDGGGQAGRLHGGLRVGTAGRTFSFLPRPYKLPLPCSGGNQDRGEAHERDAPGGGGGRRLRRSVGGPGAAQSARGRHPAGPPQLPPLPAAAVPGGDRRPAAAQPR